MLRPFFYKNFRIFLFLFFVPAITITAQENSIYNQILKESMKPDFMKMDIPLEVDSGIRNTQLFEDTNKEFVYKMLYRHRIECLLPEGKIIHFEDKMPPLSSSATRFYYTHSKNRSWDRGKFNGDGTFSGEFATRKDILESKAVRVMAPIPALFFLVINAAEKTGIISTEDRDTAKESEKDKMLRTIKKDVYHIED